jgi:hypothetical protein
MQGLLGRFFAALAPAAERPSGRLQKLGHPLRSGSDGVPSGAHADLPLSALDRLGLLLENQCPAGVDGSAIWFRGPLDHVPVITLLRIGPSLPIPPVPSSGGRG